MHVRLTEHALTTCMYTYLEVGLSNQRTSRRLALPQIKEDASSFNTYMYRSSISEKEIHLGNHS